MKIHRYVLFQNENDAQELIERINAARGGHWAAPKINPFDGRALVPWNDDYLRDQAELLNGKETISFDQAQDQGWTFGFFRGRFAKAGVKLEEARHIRVSLDAFDHTPNYPAYRALFFGLLSSLYGVKEAVRRSCELIGDEARTWWNAQFEALRKDQLLRLFYDLNNSDKHSLSSTLLRPRMKLYGYRGPAPPGLIISGEGVFIPVDIGTSRERRLFYGDADATFEVYLDVPSLDHRGQDVSSLGLKAQIDLAIAYYEDLVFEAKGHFDARV